MKTDRFIISVPPSFTKGKLYGNGSHSSLKGSQTVRTSLAKYCARRPLLDPVKSSKSSGLQTTAVSPNISRILSVDSSSKPTDQLSIDTRLKKTPLPPLKISKSMKFASKVSPRQVKLRNKLSIDSLMQQQTKQERKSLPIHIRRIRPELSAFSPDSAVSALVYKAKSTTPSISDSFAVGLRKDALSTEPQVPSLQIPALEKLLEDAKFAKDVSIERKRSKRLQNGLDFVAFYDGGIMNEEICPWEDSNDNQTTEVSYI